jgi:AcrR family transcriptional regulator
LDDARSAETKTAGAKPADDARRRALLDAAAGVFARYGFRKTSMDEVAQAAQISRPGLYLRYATKEALFRAVVHNVLETGLQGAHGALGDETQPLDARLLRAFDHWYGRHVGMIGADATDLIEASKTLLGSVVSDYEALFAKAIVTAIRDSHLARAYGFQNLTGEQLARTLHATALGLKHASATRDAFVQDFGIATQLICAPLSKRRAGPG